MTRGSVWNAVLIGGIACLSCAAVTSANETGAAARARKFGRGAMNIVSAPAELIRVPTLVGQAEGGLAGLSVGIAQGAWQMVRRAVAGIYDVVTFPLSTPPGYKSIQPEFVWAHGKWVE